MPGLFEFIKSKIVSSAPKETHVSISKKDVDNTIIFGVLLWFVADADGKFLPEERKKIREILSSHANVDSKEIDLTMMAIKTAAEESIDMHKFTRELDTLLNKAEKISMVEDLFRVAAADGNIDSTELETIRIISSLVHLSHKEFIQAKLAVKGE